MRSCLGSLAASLAIHGVLVAAVLTALPRSEVLPALFIDLTAEPDPAGSHAAKPEAEPAVSARRGRARESVKTGPERSAPAATPGRAAAREPSPPPVVPPEPAAPSLVPPPPSGFTPPSPSVPDHVASAASGARDDETAGDRMRAPDGTPAPAPSRELASPRTEVQSASTPVPSSTTAPNSGAGLTPPPGSAAVEPDEAGRFSDPAASAGVEPRAPAPPGAAGAGPPLARRSPAAESGEAQADYAEYLGGLRRRIHEALRYPAAARRRGLTGTVTLELTVLPSGLIRDVSVVGSSSHAILDEAALDSVRQLRAPPLPGHLPARTLRVRLPVVFRLQ